MAKASPNGFMWTASNGQNPTGAVHLPRYNRQGMPPYDRQTSPALLFLSRKRNFRIPLPLLVAEVTVVQTYETTAVACLVFGHLVHRVVDGIQILFFCHLGQIHLA